ncbi:ParB/RepB/Spo0J family partition protein [Streptomyces sp. LN500]|uniref:ParB/RepB/Spo0J family partition protein n=1 Tax=Streptomyces sp. LN500 TaxID=3112978 RepID=UPI00371FFEB6
MVTKSEQFSQTSSAFSRAGGARSARRQAFDHTVGQAVDPTHVTELSVELISQNPDNPRDHMRDLDYLTQTVREVGVVNAITVATVDAYLRERADQADRLDPGTAYIVIDGHRRLEASRRAGKDTIKVTVDDALVSDDESLLEAAFIANYHRDGMTELEEANALEKLVKFYGGQSKASQRLGMAQSTISSKLSYLKLSPELQADLAEGRRPAEQVRNLGKLSPDEQRARADERAEEARLRAEAAATVKPAEPNYHAVIIDEAKVSKPAPAQDAPDRATTQQQNTSEDEPPRVVEVPDPRASEPDVATAEPKGTAAERVLADVDWEDDEQMADALIQGMRMDVRHRMTTRLLRVMTTEKN